MLKIGQIISDARRQLHVPEWAAWASIFSAGGFILTLAATRDVGVSLGVGGAFAAVNAIFFWAVVGR